MCREAFIVFPRSVHEMEGSQTRVDRGQVTLRAIRQELIESKDASQTLHGQCSRGIVVASFHLKDTHKIMANPALPIILIFPPYERCVVSGNHFLSRDWASNENGCQSCARRQLNKGKLFHFPCPSLFIASSTELSYIVVEDD